ncbi:MAG TPA: type VI secretion system contractile sheath large subunit, partial [Pirellulaceae bacterium]|nr:type VI secretion system contractile sheath large subunit [Pirellulaceae bacterium]
FSHFLKKFAQDKLGTFNSADELQDVMNAWIRQYVMIDERASPEMKARYPLRRANIQVAEVRGSPGNYQMVMELLPHYQLDDMAAGLRMVTRLAGS